uniref:Uncharacterized protein n=1 Tax=Arundo donax TaxID=35708 RepID=A0A0A9HYM2_ARUDO
MLIDVLPPYSHFCHFRFVVSIAAREQQHR